MRLGLNLGYMVGADDPAGQLALTRTAEELGYGSVWAAEAYGSDSPTVLAWLAAQTSTIRIGSAVMQIPGRTPAMTAMTAAGLDVLSGGRFSLGLGVSGPQVSEGWHGVRFDSPLGRTREYVSIVRTALARRTVVHDGQHWQLPLPDGPGKPLKLMLRPVSDPVSILIAAIGPKNLEMTGEIADGWQGVFVSPDHLAEQLGHIAVGRERAERPGLDGFEVMATLPAVVGPDPQRCADPVRPYAALYVGGMGSRKANFYAALATRMGYGEAADRVQELFLSGRQRDAAAAVPFELIDQTSLLGDEHRIADQLSRLAAAGVTTCAVNPYADDLAGKQRVLTTVAAAYDRAGLG